MESISEEPFLVYPIGFVRSPIKGADCLHRILGHNQECDETRQDDWREVESEIVLRSDLSPALDGIEDFSHIVVFWWLHLTLEEERSARLKVHPRGRRENPLTGIFATRSPVRPNLIGMTIVQLIERKDNVLQVRGLDAVDGSPVIDIKPFVTGYDNPEGETRWPEWA